MFSVHGKPIRKIRTFDGDTADYFSNSTRPGSSPLTDIDGDGIPELIIAHNIGNSGNEYEIYSLAKKAKLLTTWRTSRSSVEFMDVDGDGKCEVLAREYCFFGWEACNANTPIPLVILKFDSTKLVMATDLMRCPAPSVSQREKMLVSWRKACDSAEATFKQLHKDDKCHRYRSKPCMFRLSFEIWSDMLNLIYSGNAKTAFSMLDEFWKPATYVSNLEIREDGVEVKTSRETFKKMFLKQLAHSPHLNEIKEMNSNDPLIRNLKQLKN